MGKILGTVFWDYQGVIIIECSRPGRTVTADTYFDILMHLRQAIKEKRRRLLLDGLVLMHDNAQPHTAMLTTSLLVDFKWGVFPQPPYAPISHRWITICS